jgi:hypothetical protein
MRRKNTGSWADGKESRKIIGSFKNIKNSLLSLRGLQQLIAKHAATSALKRLFGASRRPNVIELGSVRSILFIEKYLAL